VVFVIDFVLCVVVLTMFDFDDYVFWVLEVGVSGFLLKDMLLCDLVCVV